MRLYVYCQVAKFDLRFLNSFMLPGGVCTLETQACQLLHGRPFGCACFVQSSPGNLGDVTHLWNLDSSLLQKL